MKGSKIRRPSRPALVYRIAFVCLLVLSFCSLLVVSDEGENNIVQNIEEVPAQDEEQPPAEEEEETPPLQAEDPPREVKPEVIDVVSDEGENTVQNIEEVPAQDEEQPPAVEEEEEETPPLQAEDPPREVKPEVIDASLFEISVFECSAPKGDPVLDRKGRLPPGAVMTLCFRPKHVDAAELKSIEFMEFSAVEGPTQAAVHKNAAAGPMTRAICPMMEDADLCICATKLSEEFFAKAYNSVAAVGQLKVQVDSEEKLVPFRYEFSTDQDTKPPPVEHDFYEMPATPPSFPCSQEIRICLLAALVLTLLEFAFSPSEDDKVGDGKNAAQSGNSTKKKKPKKE
jgi:hypothetical protein